MSTAALSRRQGRQGWAFEGLHSSAGALTAVGVLTVIAFLLRASQLHQTLVGDEVSTYQDIYRHSFGAVLTTVHTGAENSPPLFFLLAWASAKLGDPTVWLRLPSLVLGTATVPVVYAIGRETIGRACGLIAAAVMALTPFAVYYGIEARPYATMTLFVALATLALLRAVRTGSAGWWVLYVLSSTAAAYSHYTSIFVLGVQALWSLWVRRAQIRAALIANVSILVLYLPWLPHLRGKSLSVIGQLYPLGAHRVLTDLLRPFPGHPGAPLRAIPTLAGLSVVAAGALAGFIFLLFGRRETTADGSARGPGFRLLAALALATPIGLLLYSLLVTDLWLPRGLSASLPAVALMFGALLASLPRFVAVCVAVALIATLGLGTLRSFDPAYARGPYRTIAEYLDQTAQPNDPVVVVSYVGDAVSVQLKKPHLVVRSLAAVWRSTRPSGDAYVVLDDLFIRAFKLPTPRHRGFRLTTHRHYGGNFSTELFVYRRQP